MLSEKATPAEPAGSSRSRGPRPAVLVTGAASGIGLATARRCLADGFDVGLLDCDPDGLEAAATGLGGLGEVLAVSADVSVRAEVDLAVEGVLRRFGRLDAVVNAAGVGGYTGDVVDTTPSEWDRVVGVNLSGAYLVCRAAIPHLRAASGGRIVNISSQYGLVGGAGSPAYAASKAGVVGLTRAMAVDHAAEGILVSCVCPGPVDTPMLTSSRADRSARARAEAERTGQRSLLGGPGRPEDVAGAVAYLLGPDGGHLTGVVLPVDGGWTAS